MLTPAAQLDSMTAGTIFTRMSSQESTAYLAGIVEGLAWARFVRDNRTPGGRDCIYDWFYSDAGRSLRSIHATFERYPDASPGRLVATLANTKCGG